MKSLRARLWLGFGGLLLILMIVSALSVIVLTRYSHALERVFRENYNSAVYCEGMKSALDGLDMAAQRHVWGAPVPDDQQITATQTSFDQNLHRQLENCTLPGELELSAQLKSQWSEFQSAYSGFMRAPAPVSADQYRQDLLPRYQQLKQTAQRVSDMNMANMVSVDGQAKRALIGVRNAMLVLVSVGTLIAALLVGAVGATLLRPLKALTQCVREIGAGNLDLSVDVRSSDEIGRLVQSFNTMAAQLREFRRLDHEKLARTQQTTQLAIDSLPDAVFLLSPSGKVEMANRTARQHFGIAPGAAIADLNLEWLDRLCEHVTRELRPFDPEGYSMAVQIFDNGRERFLLPHAVPVLGGDGLLIGITVTLMDVTRLRHADEAKSGLLSTVSHELRTPLTSIRMALALLTGDKLGALGDSQRKLIAVARDDTDRLYRTIENLLNLGRIESGRVNAQPRQIAVRELVSQSVEPLRHAFEQKGLALQLEAPAGLPEVWADPTSIGYALTNLLANALKFTPTGGQVVVACEEADSFVRVIVRDTGPGIPPEYASRVFEKFFRLPREQTKPGAGLGLAIAKEIVEANGGCIRFRPASGRGSEFSFTVPTAASHVNSPGGHRTPDHVHQ